MPIVKGNLAKAKAAVEARDWTTLDAMTDEDIRRQIAENPDAAPELAKEWFERAQRVGSGRRGHPPAGTGKEFAGREPEKSASIDVAALRGRLDMTQMEFARAFRFSTGAVRALEQGRRKPSGPTAAYLELIAADPEFVRRKLAGTGEGRDRD